MTFWHGLLLSVCLFLLGFPFLKIWYEIDAYWKGWAEGWKQGWNGCEKASFFGELPCSIIGCEHEAILIYNHRPGGLAAYCEGHRPTIKYGEILLEKEGLHGDTSTKTSAMS